MFAILIQTFLILVSNTLNAFPSILGVLSVAFVLRRQSGLLVI